MPIHDWTKIFDGAFHDFHQAWVFSIKSSLNKGLLPPGYYASMEQVVNGPNADVVTLDRWQSTAGTKSSKRVQDAGGIAVADCPPRTKYQYEADRRQYANKADQVAIRHASDHRLIAVIEVISPGNKNNRRALDAFRRKIDLLLDQRVHLLLIDILPPGPVDPDGLPVALSVTDPADVPVVTAAEPYSLLSVRCAEDSDLLGGFVEIVGRNQPLPEMPLFLSEDHYVNVPLESTYLRAWDELPEPWREIVCSSEN
ncbi:MAG: DUF4058 family protein [Planctomycetaceae bacterium]